MAIPTENRRRETAAKIAALTLANAFIFQEQLAAADRRVLTVRAMMSGGDLLANADRHWAYICDEINYVPIFKIARAILLALPAGSASDEAVRRLARQALSITARKAALRHDLMGRIYHWLLHDAKFLGTFYTSVPAATLLLKLVFTPERWPETDWSQLDAVRRLRVADIACGTGTLLMAACQAVTDNFIRSCTEKGIVVDATMMRDLHQTLIENVVHGYDVLPSAIHLTASTLGLLAPEIAFQNMRLFALPLGQYEVGSVFLGSIEYLDHEVVRTQIDLMGQRSGGHAASEMTGTGLVASNAPLPRLSLCVMNPPFVRSVGGNLLFGSLPRDRRVMQQKLREMLNPRRGAQVLANTTAGLGSVFTAVGDRHIQPGGFLALVVPAAITSGVAWRKTRRLVDHRYHLATVISSHEADHWAFSENTDLSEVLLIARKQAEDELSNNTTTFVNLWLNPKTSVEALAVVDSILQTSPAPIGSPTAPRSGVAPLIVGRRKLGELVTLPTDWLRDRVWIGGAYAQTDLVRTLVYMQEGRLHLPGSSQVWSIPTCRLGEIATLGPDRRDIYDGFSIDRIPTPYPAFWGHDAERVTTLSARPNRWLSPLSEARRGRPMRDPTLLWSRAGRLMLAERMWLVTQRLTAVRLQDPGLSNVWWPTALHSEDSRREKALALWLNSTLGLLLFFGLRVPTRGPWVQFKKPILAAIPVLNVETLAPKALDHLAAAYDAVVTEALEPLPAMAGDETRRMIDSAIRQALGIPDVTRLRELLAQEPIVCNASLVPAEAPEVEAISDQLALF